jgi:hypothetical protein
VLIAGPTCIFIWSETTSKEPSLNHPADQASAAYRAFKLHRGNAMRKMQVASIGEPIRAWESLPDDLREVRVALTKPDQSRLR